MPDCEVTAVELDDIVARCHCRTKLGTPRVKADLKTRKRGDEDTESRCTRLDLPACCVAVYPGGRIAQDREKEDEVVKETAAFLDAEELDPALGRKRLARTPILPCINRIRH